MRGLAAPEAANNATAGGAFVPMLTLGVPGSRHDRRHARGPDALQHPAGPQLLTERPEIVGGLIASLYRRQLPAAAAQPAAGANLRPRAHRFRTGSWFPASRPVDRRRLYSTYASVFSIYPHAGDRHGRLATRPQARASTWRRSSSASCWARSWRSTSERTRDQRRRACDPVLQHDLHRAVGDGPGHFGGAVPDPQEGAASHRRAALAAASGQATTSGGFRPAKKLSRL